MCVYIYAYIQYIVCLYVHVCAYSSGISQKKKVISLVVLGAAGGI